MSDRMKQFPVEQSHGRRRGCGVDWSSAEIGRAIRLRAANWSHRQIADVLGRTPQAVRIKLHRKRKISQPHRVAKRGAAHERGAA